MIERTISQSMYDARLKELDDVKEGIYENNIDTLTARMTRKKANGTWTKEDEKAYKEADKKCAELIAEQETPLNLWNADKINVIPDEEYIKLYVIKAPPVTTTEEVIEEEKDVSTDSSRQ